MCLWIVRPFVLLCLWSSDSFLPAVQVRQHSCLVSSARVILLLHKECHMPVHQYSNNLYAWQVCGACYTFEVQLQKLDAKVCLLVASCRHRPSSCVEEHNHIFVCAMGCRCFYLYGFGKLYLGIGVACMRVNSSLYSACSWRSCYAMLQ